MKPIQTTILAAFAVAWGTSAFGQNIEASKPATVVNAIQDLGYQALLSKDSYDDPIINSAADGFKYVIMFDGCEKHVCEYLVFSKIFSIEKNYYPQLKIIVDKWNSNNYFSKTSVEEDSISVAYSLDLSAGGMPKALFESNFKRWQQERSAFIKMIAAEYSDKKK